MSKAPSVRKTPTVRNDLAEAVVATPNEPVRAELADAEEVAADEVMMDVFDKTNVMTVDGAALVGEVKDQLNTELDAVRRHGDVMSDTLIRERMDHQNTLEKALGIKSPDGRSQKDKREEAEERLEAISEDRRDKTNDDVLNARPANWNVKSTGDGQISAVNTLTNETYEGAAKDFLKQKK